MINKAKFFQLIFFIYFLLSLFVVTNLNLKFLDQSLLNLFCNLVMLIFIIFLFFNIRINLSIFLKKKYTILSILIVFIFLFQISSFEDLKIARWYLMPFIFFILLIHSFNFNFIEFLKNNSRIIFTLLLIFVLPIIFYESNDFEQRRTPTLIHGWHLISSNLFVISFITIIISKFFFEKKYYFYQILCYLFLIYIAYLIYISGNKTYTFLIFFWLISLIIFNLNFKRLFAFINLIIFLTISFLIIPKKFIQNFLDLYNYYTIPKLLSVSGRLPDFFTSNENKSISEYWISKIIENPFGHGWVNPQNTSLIAFDGAIWEIFYSTGVIPGLLVLYIFFSVITNSLKLYFKKKNFIHFNIFLFVLSFLVLFIIGGPFNSLILPYVYLLITIYISDYEQNN